MSSIELLAVQAYLVGKMKAEIKRPDCDFKKVSELALEAGKIDRKRRLAWHKEKFGPYEKIVKEVLELRPTESCDFAADDIPF